MTDVSLRFCRHIAEHGMSNAAAKIGAWFIGAAALAGGFPLRISYRQIREGFEANGTHIAGTASRHETILQSIAELQDAGLLDTDTTADEKGMSKQSKQFTWRG